MQDLESSTITVASRVPLGQSMMRITFRQNGHWPSAERNGSDEFCWLAFPGGGEEQQGRYYTIRQRCGDVFTVDFVLHKKGLATDWARTARPGETLHVYRPRFRYEPPDDIAWVILIADITGLPAICRIIEEAPAQLRVFAHVEVPSAADRQDIDTVADALIVWHTCHGLKPERPGYTELSRIAGTITELPEGPGYIYIAGEARAVSESRKHFRDVLGFDKSRIDAIGYWIEGQARV